MVPKISIIMPVYNAGEYLSAAIDSVLAQSFCDFELILVNDGSTDNSGKNADEYVQKDSRICVLHRPNSGISATRNAGIKAAAGDYVAFMDADDLLHPDTLKDNYDLICQHSADWLKFGKFEVAMDGGKVLSQKAQSLTQAVYEGKQITDNLLKLQAEGAMSVVWNSLVSRQTLLDSGMLFDTSFATTHEDVDFCERLAGVCRKLVVNPKCYYYHCARPGISISSKYSEDKIRAFLVSMARSNERYAKYGIDSPETDPDYIYVETKQIVVNVCQKLNDAGEILSANEKREILQQYYKNPAFDRYKRIGVSCLWNRSKKLFAYALLFRAKFFTLLLLMDKTSRKLVRWIRKIRRAKA